jgi:uncharacterized membrane protein YjfL (UPF0719 family)|tara:strand:+ start:4303 stop:4824 length:522 start_codon:yes stop_codon:yes gene_type:complete
MENNLLNIALFQNLVSILLSILTIYITLKITNKYIYKKHKISKDNIAYSILLSGIILSVVYLMSGISAPILNTFRFLKMSPDSFGNIYLEMIKYIGLFLSIALLTSISIILITFFLFKSTHKDLSIYEEIQNNNIAVSIITAIIFVSFSLLIKENMILLIETFIPYPSTPNLY